MFIEPLYEHRPFALNARLWKRPEENASKDDNPDIADYMGRMDR